VAIGDPCRHAPLEDLHRGWVGDRNGAYACFGFGIGNPNDEVPTALGDVINLETTQFLLSAAGEKAQHNQVR
jgi:hypothetical protein